MAALRSPAGLAMEMMIVVEVCEAVELMMSEISTEAMNHMPVPCTVGKGLRITEVSQACAQTNKFVYRGYRCRGR